MGKEYNVSIDDNGTAFLVVIKNDTNPWVVVGAFNSLGNAWSHFRWMYRIECQEFTVGKKKIPVTDWIEGMTKAGYLD